MRRWAIISLILNALALPATAGTTLQLALPSQQPDAPPATPVGDPDVPPISLDLFGTESPIEIPIPQPLKPAGN